MNGEAPEPAEIMSSTRACIDASAIRHNLTVLRNCCREGVSICPAVKADAYGHGLALVLPILADAGIEMVAVACIAEGIEARQLGWRGRIMVFGPSLASAADTDPTRVPRLCEPCDTDTVGVPRLCEPCHEDASTASVPRLCEPWPSGSPLCTADPPRRTVAQESPALTQADACLTYGLEPTITDFAQIDQLVAAARRRKTHARVHVKLDSGMGRMGLPAAAAREVVRRIKAAGELKLESVYTHFCTADEADRSFVGEQLAAFRHWTQELRRKGLCPPVLHAANSAAALQAPETHFDMIRPGLAVYGYCAPDVVCPRPLRPALRLVSRLAMIKDLPAGHGVGYGRTWRASRPTRVGLVPIGYGDGYLRWFSNRACMTLGSRRAPVIGRVSMDLTTIDLTDVPGAGVGDEVVVIDSDPAAPNCVEALARLAGTIPYEITCALGKRIPRVGMVEVASRPLV